MQRKQRTIGKKLLVGLLSLAILLSIVPATLTGYAAGNKQVDILFTHDVHSHLNLFQTELEGKITKVGGLARIKTLIDQQKEKNPNTLLLDGGDFSMGTLVQTVYEQQAPELRLMGMLGFDASTLGNHEYDYRTEGLVNMLNTAMDSQDTLPPLVLGNIDWSKPNAEQRELKEIFEEYGLKDYIMVKKGDVNIAITGAFGVDALSCAPTCALKFKDSIAAMKETVAKIKKNEKADMIVCLSHSGTWPDEEKSEDELLAKAVPELDLIISGHTHSRMIKPIYHGNTAIVSCGEYGETLGSMTAKQTKAGRWKISNFQCVPVTESIQPDAKVQERIDDFMVDVNTDFLAQYGYKADQVIATNPYLFSSVLEVNEIHTEHNLGNIIADSYIYAAQKAGKGAIDPVDIAVVPSGTIRDTYYKGDLTVSDIFTSYSLGIGPDKIPGYPLISVYLTGKELKTAVEIDASISDMMTSARLYMSGINFSYNPKRMILNKVTDVYLKKSGENKELVDDKLYHVVVDLYSAQMLSAVTDMSYGVLSLQPKDENGKIITDFESRILYDGKKELKAWVAIVEYMGSFEKNEQGTPEIPVSYEKLQGRKVVDQEGGFWDSFFHPNKYAALIMGIVAGMVVLVAGIVTGTVLIIRKLLRKRRKMRATNVM